MSEGGGNVGGGSAPAAGVPSAGATGSGGTGNVGGGNKSVSATTSGTGQIAARVAAQGNAAKQQQQAAPQHTSGGAAGESPTLTVQEKLSLVRKDRKSVV